MSTIKLNSIGFGYDKTIKLSERLTIAGIALVTIGAILNHSKTQWWSAGDQKTLDNVEKVYIKMSQN